MASVSERMIELVSVKFGVDKEKIKTQTHLVNNLGMDSLDRLWLVVELEKEFQTNYPDDASQKIQTIGDAIQLVETRRTTRSGPKQMA